MFRSITGVKEHFDTKSGYCYNLVKNETLDLVQYKSNDSSFKLYLFKTKNVRLISVFHVQVKVPYLRPD